MDAKQEIYEMQGELRGIVNELNSIASELESKYKGIGTEECAKVLYSMAERYNNAIKMLYQINPNNVKEEEAA